MPRVAFITRSTLLSVPGGDTIQIQQTASQLHASGYDVQIFKTTDTIRYADYDLIHFFNITRPADILYHLKKTDAPAVLTPILIDYREYDRLYRKGISGSLLRLLPHSMMEYCKTTGRWLLGKDVLRSKSYLWKGHESSIRQVLSRIQLLLPNAPGELAVICKQYGFKGNWVLVPNGIDPDLFRPVPGINRDPLLVVCAARIEGIKNQLHLIKALNGTRYKLRIIGKAAPNQPDYYKACREAAGDNITFTGHLPQTELAALFAEASVHVLPSWFETCGLSSLESTAMGCRPVITEKGYARDYFGDDAIYCDPASPASIRAAVDQAAAAGPIPLLMERITQAFTWQQAAQKTAAAYQTLLPV